MLIFLYIFPFSGVSVVIDAVAQPILGIDENFGRSFERSIIQVKLWIRITLVALVIVTPSEPEQEQNKYNLQDWY